MEDLTTHKSRIRESHNCQGILLAKKARASARSHQKALLLESDLIMKSTAIWRSS